MRALAGNEGTTCVIPYRGDDMEWRHLKPLGDYGQIVPVPFDPHNEDSIRRAIGDSDVVVNLMGKDFETAHFLPWMTNWSYEQVNIDLAERVARIAVEHGASVMVHSSALAANPRSRSRWAASKGHGERAVRSVCPGATIVRPAHIFGPEDRFLNMFARMHQLLPRVPLVDGGERRTQPLWVGDFALALKEITLVRAGWGWRCFTLRARGSSHRALRVFSRRTPRCALGRRMTWLALTSTHTARYDACDGVKRAATERSCACQPADC